MSRSAIRPEATAARVLQRWEADGRRLRRTDSLVVEEPLEVRLDGRSLAVIMRMPGHDEDLALGFLLSEGLIQSFSDVARMRFDPRNRHGNVLDVLLAGHAEIDAERFRRRFLTGSSCGLCGTASLAAVRRRLPRLPAADFRVSPAIVADLPSRMRSGQATFDSTGSVHAAALFDADGGLLRVREDIGRHNAVDKIVGARLRDEDLRSRGRILVVSGRVSFEIVQKALAGGIPFLAAVSGPSALAVDLARRNGQTLVGFARDGRFNVYAGASRIRRGDGSGPTKKPDPR